MSISCRHAQAATVTLFRDLRGLPSLCVALPLTLLLAVSRASAEAPSLSVMLGYDYYSGPKAQTTWRPLGELDVERGAFAVVLSGSHFDDSQNGRAWGYTGGLLIPVAPKTRLDVAGTGFRGDSVSGAWRLKTGSQYRFTEDRTLELYYARYDDRRHTTANGVGVEFETPIAPHFSASLNTDVARRSDRTGADATLTFSWAPADLLEFTADAGISRNGSGLTGILPSQVLLATQRQSNALHGGGHGRSGSAPGGGAGADSASVAGTTISESNQTSATFLVGVRVHF